MQSEPLVFAMSLNSLSGQLHESLPLFKQLQRHDRPAPKFNGFEKNIGWDWEALFQAYNALRDLRHNSSSATTEYAIDALHGFWEYARQIGLKIKCIDWTLDNMEDVEREDVDGDIDGDLDEVLDEDLEENLDEDLDMDENDPVTDFQSAWVSSAQLHQGSMPSLHLNFATTSAGDIAKPALPSYQLGPVRPVSDDLADPSSNIHSSMDLHSESQRPPYLPLPAGLPQPGDNPSQSDSSLSSAWTNTSLGQQAQVAAGQASAQVTPLKPIPEEEEEEYEPPEPFSESEEEYEPPEPFVEVGRPSGAEHQGQSASANDVKARNASGYREDDVEDPNRFQDCNGIRVRMVDSLQNLTHVKDAFSLPDFHTGLKSEIATIRKKVREQLCGRGDLAIEDSVLTRLACSYVVSSTSRAIVTAEELQGTLIIREFQSEAQPLTDILAKIMTQARQHNSPLADNEAFRRLNDDLKQMDEILGDITVARE
jgi:hypothetical protein